MEENKFRSGRISAWDSFEEQDPGIVIEARGKTREEQESGAGLTPGKKDEMKQPDSSYEDVLTSSHPAVFLQVFM